MIGYEHEMLFETSLHVDFYDYVYRDCIYNHL